jgi:4-diphosphocytidyl-2-C-methyl-D-erythritol kinase
MPGASEESQRDRTAAGRSYTRVTLALDIVRRLTEGPFAGYHELGIVKAKIALHDRIRVEEASRMEIVCDHPAVPCDESNLCWRAAEAIRHACGIEQAVRIHIEKHIPVQGGLAGGSANAATIMELLNGLWKLGLDTRRLCELGRGVGMDVPFYFVGDTAFDTETGAWPRRVETGVKLDLVLAFPSFGVSTREAYRAIDYERTGRLTARTASMLDALERGDREKTIACMHNDFEHSVVAAFPALHSLRREMLEKGCRKVVMSGSGSTLIGVVDDADAARACATSLSTTAIVSSTRAGNADRQPRSPWHEEGEE